jgi:hypothetical protein
MKAHPTIKALSDLLSDSAVQWTAFERWKVGNFKRYILINGNLGEFEPAEAGLVWIDAEFMWWRWRWLFTY